MIADIELECVAAWMRFHTRKEISWTRSSELEASRTMANGVRLTVLQTACEFFIVLAAEFEREDESWRIMKSWSISRIRDMLHDFTYESEG